MTDDNLTNPPDTLKRTEHVLERAFEVHEKVENGWNHLNHAMEGLLNHDRLPDHLLDRLGKSLIPAMEKLADDFDKLDPDLLTLLKSMIPEEVSDDGKLDPELERIFKELGADDED